MRSSTASLPAVSVPVTTVPKPRTVNTRSIGRRGSWSRLRGSTTSASPRSAARRSARPSPAFEERGADERHDVVAHEREPVGLDEIGLRQHDEAALDAKERADREVLARLRHHALVGGDDQHRQVDAADTGEHVLDETLVPGHVDDLDDRAPGLLEEREPEVDGDPARLLLGQAVGVNAGERLHQGRLAVVDVARRPDDDVLHGSAAAESARARVATWCERTVRQSRSRRSSTTRPTTGGSPALKRSSRRIASAAPSPSATAAVGSSTVGSAPPPTCARSSTTRASRRARVAGASRRSTVRARLRTRVSGSVRSLSVGIVSSAVPASYAYRVASSAAIVNLSIRSARFHGFFLSRATMNPWSRALGIDKFTIAAPGSMGSS